MKKLLYLAIVVLMAAITSCSDNVTNVYCCKECNTDSTIIKPHCQNLILCVTGSQGARVCIDDDRWRGTIPFCTKIESGTYKATAKKDGYASWKGEIVTNCEDTLTIKIVLRKL